jgi:Plasmid pRiA4b ORF-3-like protein
VGTFATKKTSTSSIHRLKIALLSVKPQVWRRIEVESSVKLSRLSRILLEAMGWSDLHLHQFVVGDVCYGTLDPDFPSDTLDEAKFTLAKIAPHVKDRFRLEYDFGDGWEHRVVVEDIVEAKPGITYPRCTAGANACPPEDCGGPCGYADLRDILADPTHERHDEVRESVREGFDPASFNLDEVNACIQDITGDTSLYAQFVGTA